MRQGIRCGSRTRNRPSFFERLIIPRLEQYSINNDPFDVDEAIQYLRINYHEYRRIKQDPFRKLVQRALLNVQTRAHRESPPSAERARSKRLDPAEERLLRKEAKYIRQCPRRVEEEDEEEEEEDEEEEEESEEGSCRDEDVEAQWDSTPRPFSDLMNSVLRANYNSTVKRSAAVGNPIASEEPSVSKTTRADSGVGDLGREFQENNAESGMDKTPDNNKIAVSSMEIDADRPAELCSENGTALDETLGDPERRSSVDKPQLGFKKNLEKHENNTSGARVTFKDLGGMEETIDEIMEVIYPFCHPEICAHLGVQPMRGFLLQGPPGCGKTTLAHAIANETGVPFYKISATEVVTGVSGESEENIRTLFAKAYRTAPCIIFIDEIDAIGAKRETLQREMERRIVTQLMTCMDESHQTGGSGNRDSDTEITGNTNSGPVLVIGATNRPDALDPALRRPGRFDREFVLGVPDENARVKILLALTKGLRLEGLFDFKKLARCTPGFVGADLAALTKEASMSAMKRIIASKKPCNPSEEAINICEDQEVWWKKKWTEEEIKALSITMADFEEAADKVQPSTTREGFSAIPNVRWDDVGALSSLRKDFELYIVRRIKYPEEYEMLGIDLDNGFLLYGPPGCGKTLLAKAVANEAGVNFIHVKGPELLNKFVGESELAVRTTFTRARTCSPCILFFDEIDALTTRRGTDGGWVVERVLNQLLIEMDGAERHKGVFVIGATNRPEVMDPAVLRPGRFGKLLYVPLPDVEGRISILKALARKKRLASDVDLDYIGQCQACENFSGADLAHLVNEACLAALLERNTADREVDSTGRKDNLVVHLAHFEQAFRRISPSVSERQRHYYEQVFQKFTKA